MPTSKYNNLRQTSVKLRKQIPLNEINTLPESVKAGFVSADTLTHYEYNPILHTRPSEDLKNFRKPKILSEKLKFINSENKSRMIRQLSQQRLNAEQNIDK